MLKKEKIIDILLGDPEVTANLQYYDFAYRYWEGCVIFSKSLRYLLGHPVELFLRYFDPYHIRSIPDQTPGFPTLLQLGRLWLRNI